MLDNNNTSRLNKKHIEKGLDFKFGEYYRKIRTEV